jgi:hypothetical protein
MNKNRVIFKIMFLALLAGFVSCNDDNADTEKPVIVLHSPEEDDHFQPGEVIPFEVTLTDNVSLSQMKIEIHYGADHTHKSFPAAATWDYDTIVNLSGRSMNISFPIRIPVQTEAAMYHFIVQVTDKAGNEDFISVDIDIEDEVE